MIYKLVLGDWAEEGHGRTRDFLFDCNYDVSKIRQAYKDSCKKLGVAFDHCVGYIAIKDNDNADSRLIWTEYDDFDITKTAFEILNTSGCFNGISYYQDGSFYNIQDLEDCATLIMNFIALSMPEDFRYEVVKEPQIESINSWNDELNEQFGYGLFD